MYAVACSKKIPHSWTEFQTAGCDLFSGFLKRHPKLSIRSQATSLARCTSFNQHNVDLFFDNDISNVLTRLKVAASDICNIDETGITSKTLLKQPSRYCMDTVFELSVVGTCELCKRRN